MRLRFAGSHSCECGSDSQARILANAATHDSLSGDVGMRWLILAVGLLATGCGGSREGEAPAEPQIERTGSAGSAGVPASPSREASTARARDDHGSIDGNDWCQFLGPLGTSVSSETGII